MTGRGRFVIVVLTAVVGMVLTVSRRPDSLFHAQFWAEDGQTWYAEAYNNGWLQATLTSHTGYFQTLSRLTAAASLPLDFMYAPLFFNLVALIFQVLPAVFVVSPRFERLIPDIRLRVVLALFYLAVPNSFELDANITNAMTHLALLAVLVVLADPPRRAAGRAFDIATLALSGVSGPFVLALLPVAGIRWLLSRRRWSLLLLVVVCACGAVQAIAIAQGFGSRPHPPLGASVHGFIAILGTQVFAAAAIGGAHARALLDSTWWPRGIPISVLFLLGVAAYLYALAKGPVELKLFILFAFIVMAGGLLTPVVSVTDPAWPLMARPGIGDRYFVLAILAWLASLAWIVVRAGPLAPRVGAGMALIAVALVGVPSDWKYPVYVDRQPELYARILRDAPPGSRVVIPINPPGWDMTLFKR